MRKSCCLSNVEHSMYSIRSRGIMQYNNYIMHKNEICISISNWKKAELHRLVFVLLQDWSIKCEAHSAVMQLTFPRPRISCALSNIDPNVIAWCILLFVYTSVSSVLKEKNESGHVMYVFMLQNLSVPPPIESMSQVIWCMFLCYRIFLFLHQ